MGTQYGVQIEKGEQIVKEMLAKLATNLTEPKINDLSLVLSKDDLDQVSILDPNRKKIITTISTDILADAPATLGVRDRLWAQLNAAVRAHYGIRTSN